MSDVRELTQLYGELIQCRTRLEQNEQKRQEAIAALVAATRAKRMQEVCLGEFEKMPATTPFYRSVGKAYILQSQEEIKTVLNAKIAAAEKEMSMSEGKRNYYESQVKSNQKKFSEMMGIIQAHQKRQ